MRLFIEFRVPESIQKRLFEVQKDLFKADARLNLTKSFHLTLKFLGEVPPSKAEEVKKRLADVRFKPFKAFLSNTGVFPNEKMIRVVWVGVEPEKEIIQLQSKVEEALKGLFPKEKSFQPHLTLARVKFVKDKAFLEIIKKLAIPQLSFDVKEIQITESKLSREGPEYITYAGFPAQGL